jgi:hypothetical protein
MHREPQRRQIIKTRPQGPYIIARVAIVIVLAALLIVVALYARGHHMLFAAPPLASPLTAGAVFKRWKTP